MLQFKPVQSVTCRLLTVTFMCRVLILFFVMRMADMLDFQLNHFKISFMQSLLLL